MTTTITTIATMTITITTITTVMLSVSFVMTEQPLHYFSWGLHTTLAIKLTIIERQITTTKLTTMTLMH